MSERCQKRKWRPRCAISTTYSEIGLGQAAASTAARIQLFQEILGCVSGAARTPKRADAMPEFGEHRERMGLLFAYGILIDRNLHAVSRSSA
jgi:hypothetical protein